MRIAIIALLLTIMCMGEAQALSCAAPTLNKLAIEGHAIIFEGVVEEVHSIGFMALIKKDNQKLYSFRVTHNWYGESAEDMVDVVASPGWGSYSGSYATKHYWI